MVSPDSAIKTKSLYISLFIVGIVLVSFNLRPAITSVGPLVGMIQEDMGLAHWSAGLLTSLPLICFAFMSPLVPKIANHFHNELTMQIGLIAILVGILIRTISSVFFLFAGTFLIGIGIAICNVLLPVVIKDKFPAKFGLMTSVYSTSMGLIASLASGFSVPLAVGMDLGWQRSLLVWGIPAVLAIILWVFLIKKSKGHKGDMKRSSSIRGGVWRSPVAWYVALFMGFQSFLFYVTVAWLPEILHSYGVSTATAGWMLSFTQFIGLPASFFVPVIAGKLRSQAWIAGILGACSILGFGGIMLASSYVLLIFSIILLGLGLGGSFPLGLAYLGMRSRDARQAAELSGMAQSVGYILAAVGPIAIGSLYDVAHTWTVPLITLIAVGVLVGLFGASAGRNQYV
ncbi:CynX/NimT family MFS transporter [Bacillus tuaregi]|uniref:CynX/NimT family MFS transporter n=1 Tax=Bacillus tuaregi TaxID=1816695 RepID=UPI0008F830B6|nr:MFS transporter [Bacillus tuaregi]